MHCRPAISSMSLGRAWLHFLEPKLDQAQKYGFEGIELFYEDLEYLARRLYPDAEDVQRSQLLAAAHVRQLCEERNLTLIGLQPFWNYEGLKNRAEQAKRIEKLRFWFRLVKALNVTVIGVPSNFLPAEQLVSDFNVIVADLRQLADLGAQEEPPISFAYESLAWGTHVDTWERCWEIVEAVDRPNFGICLDTFNIAARVYADPAAPCGTTGPMALEELHASIARLVEQVDIAKVPYIQIVDAERLAKPLVPGHEYYDAAQPARMSWSRNCRLFYGEENRGAYLPVKEVAKALLDPKAGLGFEGWISLELFSRTCAEDRPDVAEEHARRAASSWRKLVVDFPLQMPNAVLAEPNGIEPTHQVLTCSNGADSTNAVLSNLDEVGPIDAVLPALGPLEHTKVEAY